MTEVQAFKLRPGEGIDVLDQTLLPGEERWLRIEDVEVMAEAIRSLRVRGAPLLGIMGTVGLAVAATSGMRTITQLATAAAALKATRPTAVDLGAAIDAAQEVAGTVAAGERAALLWSHSQEFIRTREREDRAMGTLGSQLLTGSVLTHCNTGTLATGGIGTALGVIRTAWERGRIERCYFTETRPLLQGARLTAWELKKLGIPATMLPDTAAASLLASGAIDSVITGADRVAANGDTANKIGTYQLALAAARHEVPFYIAAPTSTLDRGCADGSQIPIEFRDESEVGGFGESRWAPPGIPAYNPAFDVTPAGLIAAIVTEERIIEHPARRGIFP